MQYYKHITARTAANTGNNASKVIGPKAELTQAERTKSERAMRLVGISTKGTIVSGTENRTLTDQQGLDQNDKLSKYSSMKYLKYNELPLESFKSHFVDYTESMSEI